MLALPPSFLAASPLAPQACSRSTVIQKKNKRLFAVFWSTQGVIFYIYTYIYIECLVSEVVYQATVTTGDEKET